MRVVGGIVQTMTDGLSDGSTQLTAVPLDGYTFKYFVIGDDLITENPHVTESKEWRAVFCVTMRDYLKNIIAANVSDARLMPIALDRDFSLDDDAKDVGKKSRELAMADVFLLMATSPSSYTGREESDFYWKHRESSYSMSISDKKMLIKRANDIYVKYGEPRRGNTITLINL